MHFLQRYWQRKRHEIIMDWHRPGRVLDNGEVRALAVKVGDKVVFGPYSGSNTVKVDGEDLLVMSENEILAVIEG